MSDVNTYDILRAVVAKTSCKLTWSFRMAETEEGLRLVIRETGFDSYPPHTPRTIDHYFPVPPTTFNEKSWQRWVFEQCLLLENHEAGEWFKVGDERPFLPLHGPGEDPYRVHEFRPRADAFVTQDGSMREDDDE